MNKDDVRANIESAIRKQDKLTKFKILNNSERTVTDHNNRESINIESKVNAILKLIPIGLTTNVTNAKQERELLGNYKNSISEEFEESGMQVGYSDDHKTFIPKSVDLHTSTQIGSSWIRNGYIQYKLPRHLTGGSSYILPRGSWLKKFHIFQ